jgi:hypothetical protein
MPSPSTELAPACSPASTLSASPTIKTTFTPQETQPVIGFEELIWFQWLEAKDGDFAEETGAFVEKGLTIEVSLYF